MPLMADSVNSEEILKIIEGIAHGIIMNIDYLTTLDQAIGDGDHGINLGKGFRAVLEKLETLKGKDVGTILKSVGQILISNVGGAAGPLYGVAFIKAGEVVDGRNEVNLSDAVKMFETAEKGIVDLGKASIGDKTMLDAIHPAVLAIKKAKDQDKTLIEALEMSVKAAEEGAKSTIDMISKLGRSSYLGVRSKGHQDVGATSTYIILESALETLRKLRLDKR
jgi:dihydroxyacetone kinase-like protein